MVKLFNSLDYRSFLRAELQRRGERGLVTKMAEAAQCQRSHVSRVLADQLHLTTDQAFRVTRFLGLGKDETIYFMKLVEFERSGDDGYKQTLKQELRQIKQSHEDLSKRMNEPAIGDPQREMIYYSTWIWSAIHVIVSIPQYQNIAAIAQRLNLSPKFVEMCLLRLQDFGLVRKEKNAWVIAGGSIHLPKTSPLNSVQHANWRERAVIAAQQPGEEGVHYTVVQSLSKHDFEKIKQLLLKAIDDYTKISRPSKEEEIVCFTCDFFKV